MRIVSFEVSGCNTWLMLNADKISRSLLQACCSTAALKNCLTIHSVIDVIKDAHLIEYVH